MIIIGGGIIGLSLAIALRKRGATVLVVERGEPGREASYAAGGMLVDCPLETPPVLQALATASARLYPEFAHELELEAGMKVDLRDQGTILFPSPEHAERDLKFVANHRVSLPLARIGTSTYSASRSCSVLERTKRRSPSPYLQQHGMPPSIAASISLPETKSAA